MNINQSQTESLLDIIKSVDKKSLMLPEFQRDFRWEVEKTYDLFDSLIREIFIGTVIYGKPSFGMTLRELDTRPRKGTGSNTKLKTQDFTEKEIKTLAQTQGLRIVLDGQQRTTSIYRACKGLYNDPRNSDNGLRWWLCHNTTQENPLCLPFANATLPSSRPSWPSKWSKAAALWRRSQARPKCIPIC